ncbi:hypothetical protein K8R62_02245 [bacterium]|nr:hypothetical protein [bacterium]
MFDDLNQNNQSVPSQKNQNDQGQKDLGQKDNNQETPTISFQEQPSFAQSDKKEPSLKEVLNQEKEKNEKAEDMFSSLDESGAKLENKSKQTAGNFNQAIKNAVPELNKQIGGSNKVDSNKNHIFVWLALLVLVAGIIIIGFFWISGILNNQESLDLNQDQIETENSSQNQDENNDNQDSVDDGENLNDQGVEDDQEEGDEINDLPNNVNPDTDGDGLMDYQEESIGTDINNIDTDGDKLTDFEEFINYKTNPFKIDTDNDMLSDYEEVKQFKTDPNLSDTDGDTYLDGAEVKNGYNPNGEGKL